MAIPAAGPNHIRAEENQENRGCMSRVMGRLNSAICSIWKNRKPMLAFAFGVLLASGGHAVVRRIQENRMEAEAEERCRFTLHDRLSGEGQKLYDLHREIMKNPGYELIFDHGISVIQHMMDSSTKMMDPTISMETKKMMGYDTSRDCQPAFNSIFPGLDTSKLDITEDSPIIRGICPPKPIRSLPCQELLNEPNLYPEVDNFEAVGALQRINQNLCIFSKPAALETGFRAPISR